MTSGTVPGILDLEAALYDLGLESLCSKNLLPPLLGTHSFEQYGLSGCSYSTEALSGQVQSYNIPLGQLDPL